MPWTRFLGTRPDWFVVTASAVVGAVLAAIGGAVMATGLHADVATYAICLGIGSFIAMLLMSRQLIEEHHQRYGVFVDERQRRSDAPVERLEPRATQHEGNGARHSEPGPAA